MMYTVILILVWLIGALLAWAKMDEWPQKWYERIGFSIIWPLMLILYGIHYLHNKNEASLQ